MISFFSGLISGLFVLWVMYLVKGMIEAIKARDK
jgi:hypothetical protein